MLEGKKILLGVCGSIAAYKVPELVRIYQKHGASVTVMMTANARNFVTPLTLQTLSGRPVIINLFEEAGIAHIDAVRDADILVIAPATANMLAKMAWGLADDAVSTAALAAKKPVLAAPAMNSAMWANRITQRNVKMLKDAGISFSGPEEGSLACGESGTGRLSDPKKILWESVRLVTAHDLKGKKVLITAGPTREYADPVRFITNASSGKTGFALAREAYFRGADVTVVSGVSDAQTPDGIKVLKAGSAVEMHRAVMHEIADADVFIANAAVCDYRFAKTEQDKIRKSARVVRTEMVLSADILLDAGKLKKKPFIVGFALENKLETAIARVKMEKKCADMFVVNGIGAMQSDEVEVALLFPGKKTEKLKKMAKTDVARGIFDRVVKFI
jgi:phosphopantothenoylcysteine decarboxylase / phosphopantothenate---cysteine ligase